MIWIVGICALGLTLFFRFGVGVDWEEGVIDWYGIVFGTVFFGLLSALAGLVLALLFGVLLPQKWIERTSANVKGVRLETRTEWESFLGFGSSETFQIYRFFRLGPEGAVQDEVEASENVKILELEKGEQSVMKTYHRQFQHPWLTLFGITLGSRHEFYVPKGTLVR